MKFILIGQNHSCSVSDSAYSCTFLHRVVCLSVCLPVVCYICTPCSNRSMDLDAIWQVHLRGPITQCVRRQGPSPPEKKDMWGPTPSQNMKLLQTHKENDWWLTRRQHRSVIPSVTKLLWCLFNLRAMEHHLPYEITSITCLLTQVNAPTLTPDTKASTRFTYPKVMEGWVNLGGRYILRSFTCPKTVPHTGTNEARCKAIQLIRHKMLSIRPGHLQADKHYLFRKM